MALGDPYATRAQLKSYLKITNSDHDEQLDDALSSSTREIEKHCGRQFNDAVTTSARVFRPLNSRTAIVDDFHTTTGLVIKTDTDDDGVYETTWASTDYELEPLNGIRDGVPGWPYWRIKAVESELFPDGHRATLQVEARWGWAAVPAPVKQSCLILAAETFKLAGAPLGVAGFGEFGGVRVRHNAMVQRKLRPFCRGARVA
ncbi:hypothetical protein BJP40_06695 [Streptomyces sp. CC53]|uniref:head-tail connector protein n=1 Tax=Streptomyces sp. CC53 TaxID=1906740 RepID=UPI0008DEA826|nr:head-tail connector protein [Streptomyces sp. CC53]OII61209.1 hypothetical protein BJP40_06695 [Streptomyces sp. CC53]